MSGGALSAPLATPALATHTGIPGGFTPTAGWTVTGVGPCVASRRPPSLALQDKESGEKEGVSNAHLSLERSPDVGMEKRLQRFPA